MEIKKNPKVDLQRYRLTFFLVGIVLTLGVFYAALEWSAVAEGDEDDQRSLLDELTRELEMIPLLKEDPVITAPHKVKEDKKTEEIRIVEDEVLTDVPTLELVEPDARLNGEVDEYVPEGDEKNDPLSLVEMTEEQKDSVFRIVEKLPEFPGGMVEFMKWLTKNLHYPSSAQRGKVEGTCRVSFIVNVDGSIADVKMEKGFNRQCEAEALRVIRSMPQWKPGVDNGKPVRTKIMIPIVFKML